ncbi:MAG TPA: ATP-binding protein [Pseudonocardiaceae bacterium]|nr:ATP-binding protein [Pseudonocardiaceae bacterium]
MTTPERVSPATLRTLFLFEDLQDHQLEWVAEHSHVKRYGAGAEIATEGEPAEWFYILLSGAITLSRLVRGDDVEITRSDQPGVYAGATQFYLGDQVAQIYTISVRTTADSTVLALPAADFAVVFRQWYPMATHLLQGMFVGLRNADELVGQRERLLALGKLTAGLTHELNNPAAAAGRATVALRERVAGMRHKLAVLAGSELGADELKHLTAIQEEIVRRIPSVPELSPLQTSDREDELTDWLNDNGATSGWEIAPTLVAGGVDVDDLQRVADALDATYLDGAIRWLAYTIETETLLGEIHNATGRISALVGAAKQYSQMDRSSHQSIDVHDGLNSTLIMLSRKIGDQVRVVKDYDPNLPKVPAYAAELNQVWTNLIDNAVDAMHRCGTLTLHTALDGEQLLVEIGDTGPGVPDTMHQQIFEPFFTTKPVGEGTGLGLDVSWRIVVNRHGGNMRVISEPGDTRFQVRLPLTEPARRRAGTAP